ncbi:MAG: cell division protein FtsZ [Flavobacteriales bacterium]|nr:MAG: cell division protein FtsZ [Flavobacteriales bacterium]
MSIELENLAFDLPKNQSNVIKVIGVGGGGSNAVNHMYKKGLDGVDFVVCNTDAQALENSPVPAKIQLGASLTEGLGAGANPEIGEQAAMESIDDIKAMLATKSKMVFITVGMGGGTGTGAAPIIAKVAKELDLLTVGIVTIPFSFEGKMRNEQAQKGIAKMSKHIDSMVVINNNKLREVYGNLGFKAGFSKADEVLSTAAMGIAEVITHHYTQNIDLKDAKTVLSNSGTAIMGSAVASGQNRAQEAITKALDSPLLNDNKITGAKNVLLLIVSGSTEITIDEIGEINDYIQSEAKSNVDIIMGVGEDEDLGEAISVTIIATGFNKEQQKEIRHTEAKKIVHNLESIEQPVKKQEVKVEKEQPVQESFQETTPKKVVDDKKPVQVSEAEYDKVTAEEDFVINTITSEEPEVEVEKEESQVMLTFDMPLAAKKSISEYPEKKGGDETKQNVSVNNPRDIEVKDLEIVEPHYEEGGTLKYQLELDEEEKQDLSKDENKEIVDEELQFDLRLEKKPVKQIVDKLENEPKEDDTDGSPLNMTIEELQKRAHARRQKMKDFNYKFNKNTSNLKELEGRPAYKRMGVDLDEVPSSLDDVQNKSRISLSSDDNDIQLRSNNSYLHDNVD